MVNGVHRERIRLIRPAKGERESTARTEGEK